MNFTIDATARPGIYQHGDLVWKGDFAYDGGTNMLTPNTGWTGPYVPLWDDGPWVRCGHEPLGAVAGDDKFGVAVWMTIPTSDVTIDYGAQTKEGSWIWTGTNGSVTVPANSSAPVTADGLMLAAPGITDLRLLLDTNNMSSGITYDAGQPVGVEGDMSDWFLDPAYDDGTHGDAQSGDGIFTYTLSLNDVARSKPASGTTVQFVWRINDVQYGSGAGELAGLMARVNKADAGWQWAQVDVGPQVYIP